MRLAAAGVAVTGFVAIGGAVSPLLDGINHFAPIWLLVSVLIGAVCLVTQRGRERIVTLTLCSAAVAVHAFLVGPELLSSAANREVSNSVPRVSVVWLNTWQSGAPSSEVLDYLVASDADFVLVSELHDEGQAAFQRLQRAYPFIIRCEGEHQCDTMIFARHRPLAVRTDGAGLRYASADFMVDGRALTLVAVHLSRPNPPGVQQRQLATLTSLIQEGLPAQTILAGDFNSTPWSFTLRAFDRSSDLERHTRALPTWPAQPWTRLRLPPLLAFLPIDHVYSGTGWRLARLRRGERTASDHYPIEAEFMAAS